MIILGAVLFIVLTGLSIFCWLTFLQSRSLSRVDRLLAATVLALGQAVMIVLVTGLLGVVSVSLVAIVSLLISAFVWSRSRQLVGQARAETRSWWSYLRRRPHNYAWAAVTVVGVFHAALAFASDDVSFDSLNYHLPWVAYVLQSGSIDIFSTSVPWINVYPKSVESWYVWQALFMRDTALFDLFNLIFWLLGFGAVYSIAKKVHLSATGAWIAAFSFSFLPIVMTHVRTGYVDLPVAVLFLLLLNFSINQLPPRDTWLLWAVTAGLLAGSKGFGPVLVVIAYSAWIVKHGWRDVIKVTMQAGGVIILIAGYFYVKNWLYYGSPLYPVQLGSFGDGISLEALLGHTRGPELNTLGYWGRHFYNLVDVDAFPSPEMNPGGFGALGLTFIPALLLWIGHAFRSKDKAVLLVIGVLIFSFFIHPASWWYRFVMYTGALGALAVAYVTTHSARYGKFLLTAWFGFFVINLYFLIPSFRLLEVEDRFPFLAGREAIYETGTITAYDDRVQVLLPFWNRDVSNYLVYVKYTDSVQWRSVLESINADYIVTQWGSEEWNYLVQQEDFAQEISGDDTLKIWKIKKP